MQRQLKLQQIVPSKVCLSCDVCCRFLDQDSFLAPIFMDSEITSVMADGLFQPTMDGHSAQIKLKPHDEMYICPFFDPKTSECTIYPIRPLDCQIYPFALMYNADRTQVVLGVDTICPFGEAELQAESFQSYISRIAGYLESGEVVEMIRRNWSLVGPYQETVVTVRVLEKLGHILADSGMSSSPPPASSSIC